MSEQQSQKHGSRSEAQKTERAREGYASVPPSNAVAGAFGERETQSDHDVALRHSSKNEREENRED